jgi:5'-deoxynucleotidase YfbR-like HD superfamily hydrolase
MRYIEIMQSFAAVQQLGSITRFSKDRIVNSESVLEHTGFVCLMAYLIGRHMRDSTLDWAKLLRRATVHDLDEIYTGDVARVTKYSSPEMSALFRNIENQSIKKLNELLGFDDNEMCDDWLFAKDGDLEGTIIRAADLMAVVYKAWQEIELSGNLSVVRIAKELSGNVIPQFARRVADGNLDDQQKRFFKDMAIHMQDVAWHLQEICERTVSKSVREALVQFNTPESKP